MRSILLCLFVITGAWAQVQRYPITSIPAGYLGAFFPILVKNADNKYELFDQQKGLTALAVNIDLKQAKLYGIGEQTFDQFFLELLVNENYTTVGVMAQNKSRYFRITPIDTNKYLIMLGRISDDKVLVNYMAAPAALLAYHESSDPTGASIDQFIAEFATGFIGK